LLELSSSSSSKSSPEEDNDNDDDDDDDDDDSSSSSSSSSRKGESKLLQNLPSSFLSSLRCRCCCCCCCCCSWCRYEYILPVVGDGSKEEEKEKKGERSTGEEEEEDGDRRALSSSPSSSSSSSPLSPLSPPRRRRTLFLSSSYVIIVVNASSRARCVSRSLSRISGARDIFFLFKKKLFAVFFSCPVILGQSDSSVSLFVILLIFPFIKNALFQRAHPCVKVASSAPFIVRVNSLLLLLLLLLVYHHYRRARVPILPSRFVFKTRERGAGSLKKKTGKREKKDLWTGVKSPSFFSLSLSDRREQKRARNFCRRRDLKQRNTNARSSLSC